MENIKSQILDLLDDTIFIGNFISFCDLFSTSKDKQMFRNILHRSSNRKKAIFNTFHNKLAVDLNDRDIEKMLILVNAYLSKSTIRRRVSESQKKTLLKEQSYTCAICQKPVNTQAHLDHIIPFKYVGDELENNYQILCGRCNCSKNQSIDYQMRYLINKRLEKQ